MRSISLRNFAYIALAVTAAAAHTCMHDDPSLQREQARLLSTNGASVQSYAPSVHTEGGRLFHAKQAQPIRIVFSYDDLFEAGAFCSTPTGTAPSYRTDGSTVACDDPLFADLPAGSTVLNSTKIAILQNNILPAAVTRLQRFLSVQPVVGGLTATSTTVCGADFTVPASHATGSGVPSADVVIYVASSPIPGDTVAFAGACQRDQNGRAIFGRMNFGTENIKWGDAAAEESLVDTAVHEILHVLGITSTEFFSSGRSGTATKRGKTVRMVTTASVRDFVRQYTGCSTLEGAEIEDEQSSGPEGSHWERKLYADEVMAAFGGPTSAVSGITLGFLHDMNVGYTVNLAAAEPMQWSAGDGCGPHDNKCNTAAGLRDKYFCFDEPSSRPSRCTWDLLSIGRCDVASYTSALPSYFQYYSASNVGGGPFMDGCPHVERFSNRRCSIESAESTNDVSFGYTYSPTSRCFDTTGVILNGRTITSGSLDGPRCLQSTCASNTVSFRVGQSASYTTCGAAGTTQPASSGYDGSVTCPAPAAMCSSLGQQSPTPAPTPVPTNADGSTSSPAPTTTTVAPTTTAAPSGGGGISVGGVTIRSPAFDPAVGAWAALCAIAAAALAF